MDEELSELYSPSTSEQCVQTEDRLTPYQRGECEMTARFAFIAKLSRGKYLQLASKAHRGDVHALMTIARLAIARVYDKLAAMQIYCSMAELAAHQVSGDKLPQKAGPVLKRKQPVEKEHLEATKLARAQKMKETGHELYQLEKQQAELKAATVRVHQEKARKLLMSQKRELDRAHKQVVAQRATIPTSTYKDGGLFPAMVQKKQEPEKRWYKIKVPLMVRSSTGKVFHAKGGQLGVLGQRLLYKTLLTNGYTFITETGMKYQKHQYLPYYIYAHLVKKKEQRKHGNTQAMDTG